MKKQMLKMVVAMVLCCNLFALSVQAAGPRDGEIVDGSLLTSDTSASAHFQNMLRGAYLSMGDAMIVNYGRGVLYMDAATYCYRTCDKVKAYVYLERLEGDEWEPVLHQYCTELDNYYADNGFYVTVDTGYYYRVIGTHAAIKENEAESNYTITNGIFLE